MHYRMFLPHPRNYTEYALYVLLGALVLPYLFEFAWLAIEFVVVFLRNLDEGLGTAWRFATVFSEMDVDMSGKLYADYAVHLFYLVPIWALFAYWFNKAVTRLLSLWA